MDLIKQASSTYQEQFDQSTNFERSIFTTWTCKINDCSYCYMSTQAPSDKGKRSMASICAEVYLTKKLGWDLGFLTGGIGVWSEQELVDLARNTSAVAGEKVMMNFGPMPRATIEKMLPYVKGMALAIEVLDRELHEKICPSKKLEPFFKMARDCEELGLQKMVTLILGLGENKTHYPEVKQFFRDYGIDKIQYCLLKPQQDTPFELSDVPDKEYHLWWIARTRVDFPKMHIKTAIIKERIDTIPDMLRAGTNTLGRFPATKLFGTQAARNFEEQVAKSGRVMRGSLTVLPDIDYKRDITALPINDKLKEEMIPKVEQYLARMKKNLTLPVIDGC